MAQGRLCLLSAAGRDLIAALCERRGSAVLGAPASHVVAREAQLHPGCVEVLPVHDQTETLMRLKAFHVGRLLAAIDLCVCGLCEFREGEADFVGVLAGGGRQPVEGGEDLLRFAQIVDEVVDEGVDERCASSSGSGRAVW
jgi:hypothetical protein